VILSQHHNSCVNTNVEVKSGRCELVVDGSKRGKQKTAVRSKKDHWQKNGGRNINEGNEDGKWNAKAESGKLKVEMENGTAKTEGCKRNRRMGQRRIPIANRDLSIASGDPILKA
jgi:hypothetical protein